MQTKVKAAHAIKLPQAPRIRKNVTPIRASQLLRRRYDEALKEIERTCFQREVLFSKLARQQAKLAKLGRQAKRYERLLGIQ